jgi:hypothetical protein
LFTRVHKYEHIKIFKYPDIIVLVMETNSYFGLCPAGQRLGEWAIHLQGGGYFPGFAGILSDSLKDGFGMLGEAGESGVLEVGCSPLRQAMLSVCTLDSDPVTTPLPGIPESLNGSSLKRIHDLGALVEATIALRGNPDQTGGI